MNADLLTMPDPTCGTDVVASASAITWDDAGDRYYFCSPGCRSLFADHLRALDAGSA